MGFTQLLVFSGLVLRHGWQARIRSSLWLSLLLLLIALYISPFMLGYAGWYANAGYRDVLFYLPLQQVLIIGPLFLYYFKSLILPHERFSSRDWLHLLPGALNLIYSLIVFVGDIFIFDEVFFYADGQDKDLDPWYQVAGFLSMITYFILTLKVYQDYRKRIFDTLSYAEEVTYNWVRVLIILFLALLILRGLFFIINPEWGEFGRKFWYYLAIAIIGYYLSIQGYRQSLLLWNPQIPPINPDPGPVADPENPGDDPADPPLTAEDEAGYGMLAEEITDKMKQEAWYKNPALTLNDLATELNTNTRTISQAINKGTGLNFNDFCNQFRVEAVVRELEKQVHESHTLLGIAFSCGFNSKSTFNRAFKKFKGTSPKDYLEQVDYSEN